MALTVIAGSIRKPGIDICMLVISNLPDNLLCPFPNDQSCAGRLISRENVRVLEQALGKVARWIVESPLKLY